MAKKKESAEAAEMEVVKAKIAPLSLDTGREETNTIIMKVNELISFVNNL